MAATLMAIAEIADEPTAVAGVDSSTWTPITAIAALFFGPDAFDASFAALPILFGLAVHLLVALVVGVIGVAVILVTLGGRPAPVGSAALGFVYGLTVQVVAVNVTANGIEADNLVYESLPQWGWWVAHAAFGTTLGLAAARALPVTLPRSGADASGRPASPASAS